MHLIWPSINGIRIHGALGVAGIDLERRPQIIRVGL